MQVILHRYTFRNICEEEPELQLDDGACRVILCAEGTADDVSDELAAFLRYLAKQETGSDFTKRLDAAVQEARREERWRLEYMTLLERDELMKEAGRKEGIVHGRLGMLFELVDSHVLSVSEAAVKAGMSEEAFLKAMEETSSQNK